MRWAPGAVERHRLLAHDVLAGGQRLERQRLVQVVGRADVDDVDAVGLDQLLARGEGPLGPQLLGGLLPGPGDDPATPTSLAPARRADRAWTRPMNPVPTTAVRKRLHGGNLRRALIG